MSSFDTIRVPCPSCGHREDAQTKSGKCNLRRYNLESAPAEALLGVNTWAPFECSACGTMFRIHLQAFGRSVPVSKDDDDWDDEQ